MIIREHYLKQIRGFYDSDLIKIITGIRRCGKSVILGQIMDEVKRHSKNVIYLNFEDERVRASLNTAKKLLAYIDKHRGRGLNYLFFDEIQEVEGWQLACRTLRLSENSLFITGSNSKLLSKEYIKEFSGRYIAFQIRPFVYREILELKPDTSVMDYLVWGGFPKSLEFQGEDKLRYLNDLNSSIVENDLIVHYQIKNVELFRRVVNFVLLSNARIISSRSIEAYLKNEHIEGSINTIIKYLNYLEEAYIIERIKPYSQRTKSELSYYFKLYDADVSLNSIRHLDNRYDLTHNLENVVYNELIYRGYKVSVYNHDGREVDFLAQKSNVKNYIQVAYSVAEDKAYEREFGALTTLDGDAQKILITNDDLDYSTSTVKHLRLKEFLVAE